MSHGSDISPLTRIVARLDQTAGVHPAPGVVATNFPSIDRALGGGFRPGDLVVVGGDDSSGVSSLLLAIALRVSPRALLLTTEFTVDRVYERALAMAARVPLESLRLGVVTPAERTRLAAAATMLRDHAPVVELIAQGGIAFVARAIDAAPMPLVIVDALEGLLDRADMHDEAYGYLVLELKRLALTRGVVILLATHLPAFAPTRIDRRPVLGDLGRGGAIGAQADIVTGLYREELYEADLGVSGAAELRVLKHRDGARGYVDLYFDGRCGRFEDVGEA